MTLCRRNHSHQDDLQRRIKRSFFPKKLICHDLVNEFAFFRSIYKSADTCGSHPAGESRRITDGRPFLCMLLVDHQFHLTQRSFKTGFCCGTLVISTAYAQIIFDTESRTTLPNRNGKWTSGSMTPCQQTPYTRHELNLARFSPSSLPSDL